MPVFLEPNKTFRVVLDADKELNPRPEFLVKSQSMRGQLAVLEVLDQLAPETKYTTTEIFENTIQKLMDVVVGWNNMGIEFDAEKLGDQLTYTEARELLRKVAFNQDSGTIEHIEKKD